MNLDQAPSDHCAVCGLALSWCDKSYELRHWDMSHWAWACSMKHLEILLSIANREIRAKTA